MLRHGVPAVAKTEKVWLRFARLRGCKPSPQALIRVSVKANISEAHVKARSAGRARRLLNQPCKRFCINLILVKF
jgi:hypothetical protein